MRIGKSNNIQIWVGLRFGYSDKYHNIQEVREICDRFVNEIKDCITITQTEFRYVNGSEPGVIIGFINYLRFQRTQEEQLARALMLAEHLRISLHQTRVSVTTPTLTYLLEDE